MRIADDFAAIAARLDEIRDEDDGQLIPIKFRTGRLPVEFYLYAPFDLIPICIGHVWSVTKTPTWQK